MTRYVFRAVPTGDGKIVVLASVDSGDKWGPGSNSDMRPRHEMVGKAPAALTWTENFPKRRCVQE